MGEKSLGLESGPRRCLKTKGKFEGENSHVLIIRDCRLRECHEVNEEGQRTLKALY